MKNEGKTWNYIAEQVGSKIEIIRKAYMRHKLYGDLPPKEKRDMSKFGGRLGPILKRTAMAHPTWTYPQLAEEIKTHCRDDEEPPSKDSVQRVLSKNGFKLRKLPKNH